MTAEQSATEIADTLASRAIVARDRLAKLAQLTTDQPVNRRAIEHRLITGSTLASHFLALREWQVGRPRQPALALVGTPLEPFLIELERFIDHVAETLDVDLDVPTPTLAPLPGKEKPDAPAA